MSATMSPVIFVHLCLIYSQKTEFFLCITNNVIKTNTSKYRQHVHNESTLKPFRSYGVSSFISQKYRCRNFLCLEGFQENIFLVNIKMFFFNRRGHLINSFELMIWKLNTKSSFILLGYKIYSYIYKKRHQHFLKLFMNFIFFFLEKLCTTDKIVQIKGTNIVF